MSDARARDGRVGMLRVAGWVAYAVSVIVGAVFGFGFGLQLGSYVHATLLALLGALFCSILMSGAIAATEAALARFTQRGGARRS